VVYADKIELYRDKGLVHRIFASDMGEKIEAIRSALLHERLITTMDNAILASGSANRKPVHCPKRSLPAFYRRQKGNKL
jgi:hypothetical protein